MTLFYNTDILNSDGDYIIAGARSGGTYNDVYFGMIEHLQEMIEEYVERTLVAESKFHHKAVTKQNAYDNIAHMIEDSLKTKVNISGTASATEAILKSDQMQKWLLTIKGRIKEQAKSIAYAGSSTNMASSYGAERDVARISKMVEEAGIEKLIEELSSIEL